MSRLTEHSTTFLQDTLLLTAERSPDKTAFRFDDDDVSYGALAERAARLAHCLRKNGVGRGDRVAIWMDKSLNSALAIFGVLMAGAAYVPVDPGSPPARVRSVLSHCGARVMLTAEPMRRRARGALEGAGVEIAIGLDDQIGGVSRTLGWAEATDGPATHDPIAGAHQEDPAYIMFSSGSTGRPKGIVHGHRDALAYAHMAASLYGLRADDRLGNATPLHFDMSTFDFFAGPLAGAQTVIVPEEVLKMPASLGDLIEETRLTVWYSAPFALILLLQNGNLEGRDLSALRWVLFGGEPFVPKHLAALTRLLPGAKFSNSYGPAEVNQCTYFNLQGPWDADDGQPPIGNDCPGNRHLVLDTDDRIVASGETGELMVAAPTMMRGYWDDPEMTARSLYRDADGTVFYRTGDLVREHEDGALRFEGRRDRQIKTRGHLVRLDEVEEAISAHPGVLEVAAFAIDDGEGLVRIRAAAVLRRGADLSVAELRRFCADVLPPYAMPNEIEIRSIFPRTSSGKIDRLALMSEVQA